MEAANVDIVTLTYEELLDCDADLSAKIEAAFGPCGLGIVTVSGVPGYPSLRSTLLPFASKLGSLPDEAKARLEDPSSSFQFGWSHGKESLQDGKPDRMKGSFYANPIVDVPTTDEELIKRYPSYCSANVWPREDLPGLEHAFKSLGQKMVEVGALLARHCDKYVEARSPRAQRGRLERILKGSRTHKARLLFYYPTSSGSATSYAAEDLSSWCGWHTDHCSLTGLTCAMYEEGDHEVACPDPCAGLYIRHTSGDVVKVVFPKDHIAYQLGEATQIHSGGMLRATPHCVRAAGGPGASGVSRSTFAVFMQPHWDEPMDVPLGLEGTAGVGVGQWEEGLDFGSFTKKTLSRYY